VSQVIVFVALLFAIVIAIFAVQNTTPVAVHFLTLSADTVAVSVLVLIAAAFGALAMLLLGVAREAGLRWRHRSVAQQLKAAQARVSELETKAVSGQPSAVSASTEATSAPPKPSEATTNN
jgi:uncharacterized integral membrane protein